MSDQIECDGCGRSFTTDDAADMLAAINGRCPSCGGTFKLVVTAGAAGGHAPASPRRAVP